MTQALKRLVTVVVILLSTISFLKAQTAKTTAGKEDVVLMLNGEEKHGKITEMHANTIKFIHTGETLVYELKKADINKITFASGRVEVISAPSANADKEPIDNGRPIEPGLVAILPFKYIAMNEPLQQVVEKGEKLQNDTYLYLSKRNGSYKFQDPATTNALLYRKGIDGNTIKGYTYDELCKILGAEFVLQGTLSRSVKESVNSSSSSTTKYEDNKKQHDNSNNTTVENQYENEVTLGIFNKQNEKIFANRRTAFLNNEGSYHDALFYMLKRSPVYNK
ncbi:hypothetical protein HGH93_05405 [Chitinophaga polysaccharea]|uniref:hypothetical protein n=1 Tax=Chitinophaga TaxID=79328 RepID=UPI0014556537|nr:MULTISPECIES: hypothetical protein [Chitinophaga]NLR57523.1 hypothetical protein [Chitinophaga polysaccharea]NLU95437.1 hypothetical protein [Chitinophaga sp. Ak27]